jgi:hypothetical protein
MRIISVQRDCTFGLSSSLCLCGRKKGCYPPLSLHECQQSVIVPCCNPICFQTKRKWLTTYPSMDPQTQGSAGRVFHVQRLIDMKAGVLHRETVGYCPSRFLKFKMSQLHHSNRSVQLLSCLWYVWISWAYTTYRSDIRPLLAGRCSSPIPSHPHSLLQQLCMTLPLRNRVQYPSPKRRDYNVHKRSSLSNASFDTPAADYHNGLRCHHTSPAPVITRHTIDTCQPNYSSLSDIMGEQFGNDSWTNQQYGYDATAGLDDAFFADGQFCDDPEGAVMSPTYSNASSYESYSQGYDPTRHMSQQYYPPLLSQQLQSGQPQLSQQNPDPLVAQVYGNHHTTQGTRTLAPMPSMRSETMLNAALPLQAQAEPQTGKFKCNKCGTVFTDQTGRQNLCRHKRWKCGQKKVLCEHPGCGKEFARSDALRKHERTAQHGSPKPKRSSYGRSGSTQM